MIKIIKKWIEKRKEIKKIKQIALINEVIYRFRADMLATIGMQDLEKILQQAKDNRKEHGHYEYTNLAALYGRLVAERNGR